MQYFEKRYYDNRIGRFTTEDSVFWEVGLTRRPGQYYTDPQQWNSYSYVRNNPINYTDPSGEQSMSYWFSQTFQDFYNQGYTNVYRDVQREGEAYKEAGTQIAITAVQTLPGTGDINDANRLVRGTDLYTGQSVEGMDRWLSGVATVIPGVSGGEMRATKNVVKGFLNTANSEGIKIVKSSMLNHFNSGKLGQLGDFIHKHSNGGQESLKTLGTKLEDKRYKSSDGWVLRTYNQTTQAGVSIDLHFMQNNKTGEITNPHFKQ